MKKKRSNKNKENDFNFDDPFGFESGGVLPSIKVKDITGIRPTKERKPKADRKKVNKNKAASLGSSGGSLKSTLNIKLFSGQGDSSVSGTGPTDETDIFSFSGGEKSEIDHSSMLSLPTNDQTTKKRKYQRKPKDPSEKKPKIQLETLGDNGQVHSPGGSSVSSFLNASSPPMKVKSKSRQEKERKSLHSFNTNEDAMHGDEQNLDEDSRLSHLDSELSQLSFDDSVHSKPSSTLKKLSAAVGRPPKKPKVTVSKKVKSAEVVESSDDSSSDDDDANSNPVSLLPPLPELKLEDITSKLDSKAQKRKRRSSASSASSNDSSSDSLSDDDLPEDMDKVIKKHNKRDKSKDKSNKKSKKHSKHSEDILKVEASTSASGKDKSKDKKQKAKLDKSLSVTKEAKTPSVKSKLNVKLGDKNSESRFFYFAPSFLNLFFFRSRSVPIQFYSLRICSISCSFKFVG